MLLDGEAGFLCRVNDVDDLAKTIFDALNDSSEALKRARTATRNLGRFEPRAVTSQYERLATELADVS
jgi:hypothetical protein